jgi:hypothetical protein
MNLIIYYILYDIYYIFIYNVLLFFSFDEEEYLRLCDFCCLFAEEFLARIFNIN